MNTTELIQSESWARSILDALSAHICVIDESGTILWVNEAWRNFAVAHGADPVTVLEQSNYFEVCEGADGPSAAQARAFAEGTRAVLRGERGEFSLEYPCHSPTRQRWFLGKVIRFQTSGPVCAVISHEEITGSKLAEEKLAEQKDLLETVLIQAADAIVVYDGQGHQILANTAARRLADPNDTLPASMPLSWGKAYYPDGRPIPLEEWVLVKALRGKTTVGAEAHMVRSDGTDYEVMISAAPLSNARQEMIGAVATFSDISEHKRMEKALLHQRELLQRIIDAIPVMITIYDPNLQRFQLNAECQRVLGWSTEEARQVDLMERCYPDSDYRALVVQYMQSLEPGWRDIQITAKDGSLVDSAWANIRLSDQTLVGIGIDIRERRGAERALQQAHERLQSILESISDAFVGLDRQWRYTYVNRTAARLLQRSPRELIGRTLWEAFPATLGTDFERGLRHAMEQRVFVIFEAYYEPLAAYYECHCYPAPEGLSVFFTDTTERKRIEQALRENEARLRAIIRAVPDVLLVLDEEGRYVEILTAEPHLLYTDPSRLKGRLVSEALPEEIARQILNAIHQVLRSRQTQTIEYALPISKVGQRYYEVSIAPLGVPVMGKPAVVVLARDVTQHRLTEEHLRQAQKMEAIGQLTGGVAHDFNNLLAIILGNLELLAEKLSDRHDLQDLVVRPLQAAERGAALIQGLLTFARRQPLQPKAIQVNALIIEMSEMLCRTLGETVEVKTVLAGDLAKIVIDPSQLETALLNLALNARDAMPSGGRLSLETANVWLDEDYTYVHQDVKAGAYVLLAVSDTGVGMTPRVKEHALEPFFTTKEVGQGSGLGLSMVYGLVKRSGGHMTLYSEVGQGTTVKLYLPAVEQEAGVVAQAPPAGVELPRGQAQIVLVVEDDPQVCQLSVQMLQNLGYQTVAVTNAKEALQVLEQTPSVAALLTDVVLPGGMSGVDLALAARQRYPALKMLLTSGYTEPVHLSRLPRSVEFLRKPYRQSQLAIRLHVMLADNRPLES